MKPRPPLECDFTWMLEGGGKFRHCRQRATHQVQLLHGWVPVCRRHADWLVRESRFRPGVRRLMDVLRASRAAA